MISTVVSRAMKRPAPSIASSIKWSMNPRLVPSGESAACSLGQSARIFTAAGTIQTSPAPIRHLQHALKKSQIRPIGTFTPTMASAMLSPPFGSDISRSDLSSLVATVGSYDPSMVLPGILLPNNSGRLAYFALRSFHVESSFRSDYNIHCPEEVLRWWESAVDSIYESEKEIIAREAHGPTPLMAAENAPSVPFGAARMEGSSDTPIRRRYRCSPDVDPLVLTLRHVVSEHGLSRKYFDDALSARHADARIKHYATFDEMVEITSSSCKAVLSAILMCNGVGEENDAVREAVSEISKAHGLAMSLRTSVVLAGSKLQKIVLPRDLCQKRGVRSPRYLLSALADGDETCRQAMAGVVSDIAAEARKSLARGRALREDILSFGDDEESKRTIRCLMGPAVVTGRFLDRLEVVGCDLTNKNLRKSDYKTHARCTAEMLGAWWEKRY